MAKRVCPECGRLLQTKTNRLGVEVWPPHRSKKVSGKDSNISQDEWKQIDYRVPDSYADPCFNSAQPV